MVAMLDGIIHTRATGYTFTDMNNNCNITSQKPYTPHDE